MGRKSSLSSIFTYIPNYIFIDFYLSQHSDDPQIFKDLYDDADIINPPSKDPKEGLYEKIIDGSYAYIEWNDNIDLIMKEQNKITGRCDFESSQETFLTQRLSFAFPKNNPWVKKFNKEYVNFKSFE